ncbi:hypothetical protein HDU98_007324 [Podochytrium sp. JEL0797]|nr:hypothetical protein HDU98_007324 [Podochytrium sp. JEL0797]
MLSEKEQAIVRLLDAFFSPANLVMDLFLLDLVERKCWIPISLFESAARLGPLAHDEVVVAKAVRQGSNVLEVSEDGKALRRRLKVHEIDVSLMRYIEDIPQSATVQTAIHALGTKNIKSIHLPLLSIIYAANLKNKQNPLLSDLLHLDVDSVPADSFLMNLKLPGFAFVTLRDSALILPVGARWKQLHENDAEGTIRYLKEELEFLETSATADSGDSDWNYVHSMTMIEWQKQMKEYQTLLTERRSQLDGLLRSKKGSHDGGATFESGVVAKYSGVHKGTSRKVLKQLFDLLAPVSFVDHPKSHTEGHVRFKTAEGALHAASFLRRQTIAQVHANDTSGCLITSMKQWNAVVARRGKKEDVAADVDGWGEWEVEDEPDEEEKELKELGIKVRVLMGREEREYWDVIYEAQEQHQHQQRQQEYELPPAEHLPVHSTASRLPKDSAGSTEQFRHQTFEERKFRESAAATPPAVKKTHIKFGDADVATPPSAPKSLPHKTKKALLNQIPSRLDSAATESSAKMIPPPARPGNGTTPPIPKTNARAESIATPHMKLTESNAVSNSEGGTVGGAKKRKRAIVEEKESAVEMLDTAAKETALVVVGADGNSVAGKKKRRKSRGKGGKGGQ